MTTGPLLLPDRSAHASIRGYCYQFDQTILQILDATQADVVVVIEGLEDIDLLGTGRSSAVQVKYWSSRRYATPRSLHEPIEPMLEAFCAGHDLSYILYVYFGEGGEPPASLSVDQLKECLTRTTRKPKGVFHDYEKYDDSTLGQFVKKLEIRQGSEYSAQRGVVITALSRHLSASEQDVEDLHYANALALVQTLAMNPNDAQRRITRSEFLSQINKREGLYERWHLEVVGVERYVKGLGRRLRARRFLDTRRDKGIVVSTSGGTSCVTSLAHFLATQEYGPGKLDTTKPWTLIVDGEADEIREIKCGLLRRGVALQDGYESIEFQPSMFDLPPIVNRQNRCSSIKCSSYSIRLLSLDGFRSYVKDGRKLTVLLVAASTSDDLFSDGAHEPPVYMGALQVEHIQQVIAGGRR